MASYRHRAVGYSPAGKPRAGAFSFANIGAIIKIRAKAFSLLAITFCLFVAFSFSGLITKFFPWAHIAISGLFFVWGYLLFESARKRIKKPVMSLEQKLAAIRRLSMRNVHNVKAVAAEDKPEVSVNEPTQPSQTAIMSADLSVDALANAEKTLEALALVDDTPPDNSYYDDGGAYTNTSFRRPSRSGSAACAVAKDFMPRESYHSEVQAVAKQQTILQTEARAKTEEVVKKRRRTLKEIIGSLISYIRPSLHISVSLTPKLKWLPAPKQLVALTNESIVKKANIVYDKQKKLTSLTAAYVRNLLRLFGSLAAMSRRIFTPKPPKAIHAYEKTITDVREKHKERKDQSETYTRKSLRISFSLNPMLRRIFSPKPSVVLSDVENAVKTAIVRKKQVALKTRLLILYYGIKNLTVGLVNGISIPNPRAIRYSVAVVASVYAIFFAAIFGDQFPVNAIKVEEKNPQTSVQEYVVQSAVITPPEYTKLQPIVLSSRGERKLFSGDANQIPEGSVVNLQVTGGDDAPALEIDGEKIPLTSDGNGAFTINQKIKGGNSILLRKGWKNIAAWKIQVVKDSPPKIKFTESPQALEHKTVKLSYETSDDYGVETVSAKITPLVSSSGLTGDPLEIVLSAQGAKKTKQVDFEDFTSSAWAGMPVEIKLTAKDAAGNVATTETAKFILPEREFLHPLARALVDERKKLKRNPDENTINEAANTMAGIARQSSGYRKDPVVTMSLRAGAVRLVMDREKESLEAINTLLWDTAVRIEDGTVGASQNMLRLSQRDLSTAMDGDASEADLGKLIDRSKIALYRYLSELSSMEQKTANDMNADLFLGSDSNVVSIDDISSMFEEVRSLVATDRSAARQKFFQLRALSELIRPMPQGETPEQQQMLKQMALLRSILKAQKALSEKISGIESEADKTLPLQQAREFSAKQSALLHELNSLEADYYGFTDSASESATSMKGAVDALSQGDKKKALVKQNDVVEALKKSASDLADQIRASIVDAQNSGAEESEKTNDPLDRSSGIVINDGELETSDQMSLDRAKEIIDELQHKKDSEPKPKTKTERDYIDKLLQNF